MCLIVDTNVSSKVFLANSDPNFKCVYAALFGKKKPIARIVYGGKLLEEYKRMHQVLEALEELDRLGRATVVADELIDKEFDIVIQMKLCCSNDEHIIALARASDASGARHK